jgi:hypothetical protein
MADLEEQRRKVEELKKKILEQKTKGMDMSAVLEVQQPQVIAASKIISSPDTQQKRNEEENRVVANVPKNVEPETQRQPVKEGKKTELNDAAPARRATTVVALQAYAQALKQAWSDGNLTKDEQDLLITLRRTLGIGDEEHQGLEQELQAEIYSHALRVAWKDGNMSTEDSQRLELFRSKFHISADEHFRLEKQVREELLRTK